jgi:hypothetical protein
VSSVLEKHKLWCCTSSAALACNGRSAQASPFAIAGLLRTCLHLYDRGYVLSVSEYRVAKWQYVWYLITVVVLYEHMHNSFLYKYGKATDFVSHHWITLCYARHSALQFITAFHSQVRDTDVVYDSQYCSIIRCHPREVQVLMRCQLFSDVGARRMLATVGLRKLLLLLQNCC